MPEPVHLVAVLPIKEGKLDRLKELLNPLIKRVHAKETGCSRYHMHEDAEGKIVIFIETYDSDKDVEIHRDSDEYKHFFSTATSEELLSGKPNVYSVKGVAGFENRSGANDGLYGV